MPDDDGGFVKVVGNARSVKTLGSGAIERKNVTPLRSTIFVADNLDAERVSFDYRERENAHRKEKTEMNPFERVKNAHSQLSSEDYNSNAALIANQHSNNSV